MNIVGSDGATISAFMDAVTNAYGSDVWQGITSNSEFYAADFASKVTQIDGVSAVYNNAGDVLYYTYNEMAAGAANTAATAINSNVGSVVTSTEISVPATATVAQSGQVAATSGLMEYSGGMTVGGVIKTVGAGVLAVAAGVRLGAAIDSALYNANPDFWDANGMSTLNPETWDTLVCDYGEPATNVFNMFFGIDKTNNEIQPYIDERALAYITQYMASQGVWDSGGRTWDGQQPSSWNLAEPINPSSEKFIYDNNEYLFLGTQGVSTIRKIGIRLHDSAINDVVATSGESGNSIAMIVTSKSNFSGTGGDSVLMNPDGTYGGGGTFSSASSYTYDGKTVYYNVSYSNYPNNTLHSDYDNFGMRPAQLAWILQYGTFIGGGGVEGITTQDGATTPTGITPQMSIDDVLNALRTQYPDLFDDAIYDDVIQPDGSVTRHIYVPVSFPDTINVDDDGNIQPTGGHNLTQNDPAIDPETTPKETIDTLTNVVTGTDPTNPTRTPTDPPTDFPDTGGGTTPTVILPDGQASALYSIYNPTQAQINSLGAWLWSSNFVDQLLKLFNDPMQAIIGLHKVFATPPTNGTGTIKVGYLDSGVSSKLVSAQYTSVDCGGVDLNEYFGNALDYTNTDIYLYLPFVGIVPVSTLDVVRSTINVKYKVDVLTGVCMAQVYVNRDNNAGGQLYCYAGDCAVKYPLSSGSYMGIVSSILGIAGGVVGTIASGGAMLPLALGAGASALNSARTSIEHSGSLSGNAGAMGIKKPYFIIRRPQTKIADDYKIFNGHSNNVFDNLGNCTGYTRVKYVNLENIPATGDELTEIENILKSGVII